MGDPIGDSRDGSEGLFSAASEASENGLRITSDPISRLTPCADCGRLAYATDVVAVPAADYAELLRLRGEQRPFLPKPSRSPLSQDRELAAFILDCARPGTMILRDIRAACLERFGEARAPSLSAIHRFINAARKAPRQVSGK